jgi:hypothetical protein
MSTVVMSAVMAYGVQAAERGFSVEKITRVTNAAGKSQTARDNARCICVDSEGTAHMVWTDDRDGNVEIYYATLTSKNELKEMRLTRTQGESSFPCIANQSNNVYILWQESVGKTFQIYYLHLADGKEVARRQITSSLVDAGCPAAAVGPDKTLHVAWHEGPYNMTTVFYGEIVGDSLVTKKDMCSRQAIGFRPDIAVDAEGRVLIVWFAGLDIESRLWDGKAWGEETLAATNKNREWRLSVTDLAPGNWALAWFDQTPQGTDVLAKFFDGEDWYGQTRVNTGQNGFYATSAKIDGNNLMVAWEDQDRDKGEYLLLMRCYDGRKWSEPADIARGQAMSRYCSLAPARNVVHAIWFSPKFGNDEIFHGLLRRK